MLVHIPNVNTDISADAQHRVMKVLCDLDDSTWRQTPLRFAAVIFHVSFALTLSAQSYSNRLYCILHPEFHLQLIDVLHLSVISDRCL